MNKTLLVILFLLSPFVGATTITINVADGAGEGFNDATYGASRLALFEHAADLLEPSLNSDVDIIVNATFDPLFCDASSATLGQAGPTNVSYDFAEAAATDLIYPLALANALHGSDLSPGVGDIDAAFNSNLDSGACLGGNTWYYGFDEPPAGKIDLLTVVLHELLHGLGFVSYVSSTGARPYYQWLDGGGNVIETVYLDDVFSANLKQNGGTGWADLDGKNDNGGDATRSTDMRSDALVWTGANVNGALGGLTAGVLNSQARMYSPATYQSGSSVSHFDTSLEPSEIMEPVHTGFNTDIGLAYEGLLDIGWPAVVVSNVVPVIDSQNVAATNEDTNLTLSLSMLNVTDSDNTYPDDFSLTPSAGANYSLSGLTLTPAANFNGTLTVPVVVNDGADDSNSFNLQVTVNAVNDKPVISAQSALSVDEDNNITLVLTDFTTTDPESDGLTLVVGTGTNYSVSGNTITPSLNFNGSLTVPVHVNDGNLDSDSYSATVTVNSQNDAPVVVSQTTINVIMNDALTFDSSMFTITDPDDNAFTVHPQSGANYSVSGSSITPSTDFVGNLTVPVTVFDGESYSSAFNVVVAVNPPSSPLITDHISQSINEDQSLTLTLSMLSVTDVDSTYPDDFSLVINSGDHYTVNNNQITPSQDFNGSLNVSVQVNDGYSDSNEESVLVTVNEVNDKPVLVGLVANLAVNEDESLLIELGDFNANDVENDSLTLMLLAGDHYDHNDNTLTPEADFNGVLSVNAIINDGNLDSDSLAFAVTVNSVNDAPQFITSAPTTIAVGNYYQYDIGVTDVDNDALTITLVEMPTWLGLIDSQLSGGPSNANAGENEVTLRVSDGDLFADQTFTINVTGSMLSDVSVELSIDQAVVDVNESANVTVLVKQNMSFTPSTGQVSVVVPQNILLSSLPNACVQTTGLLTCDYSLAVAQSAQQAFVFSATPNSAQNVKFTANVVSQETDVVDANEATLQLTVLEEEVVTPDPKVPPFGSGDTWAMDVADINADGLVDIILANGDQQVSQVFGFNADFSQLNLLSTFGGSFDSRGVAHGDFDKNGLIDIVLANRGNNSVYLNQSGSFTEQVIDLSSISNAVAVADFDLNGFDDVVFANNGQNDLYLNYSGQLQKVVSLGNYDSRAIVVLDINFDGRPDIFVANADYYNILYINQPVSSGPARFGSGGFDEDMESVQVGSQTDESTDVVVADLDGDGIANELVIANESGDTNVIAIEADASVSVLANLESGAAQSVAVGDVDGDGVQDISIVNNQGVTQIYSPDNEGDYEITQLIEDQSATSAALVDVDNDGQADWIVAKEASNDIYLSSDADSTTQNSEPAVDGDSNNSDTSNTDSSGTNNTTTIKLDSSSSVNLYLVLILILLTVNRFFKVKR